MQFKKGVKLMEKLKVGTKYFDFWLSENIKKVECVDCIEGVLLDSLLYVDESGKYTAFIDTFLTTNSSCYTMITGSEKDVLNYWEQVKTEREQNEQ